MLIALFNSDPNSDRRYELTITIKRKAPAKKPDATFVTPKQSPFAPRR